MDEAEEEVEIHPEDVEEDEGTQDEEIEEEMSSSEEYEDINCRPIYVGAPRGKPTPARIHDLSRPIRRRLLNLYEEYGAQLPPEKLCRIKKMVEESYCLSPEQTGLYFQELRAEAEHRRKLKKQRRKEHLKHKKIKNLEKKAKVRLRVICILRDLMIKAYNTPMKLLMSERLRQISDICLSQICEILDRCVPDRDSTDMVSRMLISFADWMAYWIQTIAYEIEATRTDLDEVPSCVNEVQNVEKIKQ